MTDWLTIRRGWAPLLISIPHAGTEIAPEVKPHLNSSWLALKDTDWWIPELYEGTLELDVTVVRTSVSRAVIDVNRDPSGKSLYPGQATTELCPLTTFDAEALYKPGAAPDAAEIVRRRERYFLPYHAALSAELERLRSRHARVVLYDAHSIRSQVPRLFDGQLPQFNIGTNSGASCDLALTRAIEAVCTRADFTRTTDGRFRGGWITRHYGRPAENCHAVQMELAMRGYLQEPPGSLTAGNWPPRFDERHAAPLSSILIGVLRACIEFASARHGDLK